MYTGVSARGLDAILMQCDERGKNYVYAYANRILNSAEANYSVPHLETLALTRVLKHFCRIILCYPFTIYTDHGAVTELFTDKSLTGKLMIVDF